MFRQQQQKRSSSIPQFRSQMVFQTIDQEDLNKYTRAQLLKTAKKMGIQNLYKNYLKKGYLVDLIQTVNRHQQEVRAKRGKSIERQLSKRLKQKFFPVKLSGERVSKSGLQIQTYVPIGNKYRYRNRMDYLEVVKYLTMVSNKLDDPNNHRSILTVVIKHEDNGVETIKISDLLLREQKYNADLKDLYYQILKFELKTLPQRGGCDTKEHTVTSLHYLPSGEKFQLTLKTCKTRNNNCLINIFAKQVEQKQINDNYLRKQLGFALDTPLEPKQAELLSMHFKVSYKIFSFVDNTIKVIAESQQTYPQYVEIFLDSSIGHYSKIVKRPEDLTRFQPSHQFEQTKLNIETGAKKIIALDEQEKTEKIPKYTHEIEYAEVLNDPDLETILNRVYDTDKHIFISGEGGVGKTWTLNQIDGVTRTATTGIAATHINGNTIHHYIARKLQDCKEIIVIDEISMMGTALFQQLYQMIQESKKTFRLIIAGDILQLPPAQDGFFFQCYEFIKFAKKCIRINLTKIKRQNNIEQQQFLNNLRVGIVDKKYLKTIGSHEVKEPQVIICGKNKTVDKYNQEQLQKLTSAKIKFVPEFIPKAMNEYAIKLINKIKKNYETVSLCVGAKVILLHNLDVQKGFVNGSIGLITEIKGKGVQVQFPQGSHLITYTEEVVEKQVIVKYMPLRPCYAITVHKSQGCTFDSAIVENQDLFENGQMYVALSRVRDLNNIKIVGSINDIFITKAFKPNLTAYDFCYKNVMMTQFETMLINDNEKQLKGVNLKKWKDPTKSWNHIYLDFETYIKQDENHMFVQKPYFNKIKHIKAGQKIHEKTYFDQLWEGGQRCDVANETWNYIKNVMVRHGDNLKKLKDLGTDDSIKIYKKEVKLIPTLIAYNGSGFDFQFILKKFLNDVSCSRRFEIHNVFKGSRLVTLFVRDKISSELVLKTHDMAEILLCPLKKALTDFCKGNIYNQVVEKIEFKEEIIYIMNNYAQNPNILKPGVISNITKRLFTSDGIIEKETQKQVNLFEEVIKYAENDVDVLPILYLSMDELSKKAQSTNITSFVTAGSLAWYGLLSNLPNECLEEGKYDKNRHRMTKINSKLFRLEMKELEFVKKAIK